ncbi:MAG TPA: twin transmembrane helix small protein [Parvularcula sp.]|nr:twin transmembrane helix small protein [Parvularcula sp.]
MNNLFVISMLLAMLAVLGILAVGLFSMIKGGDFNKKHGNRLMQLRVTLQGVALALFALAYLTS